MQIVCNKKNNLPIIKKAKNLPCPGVYRAIISGIQTRAINPLTQNEEFCLIVEYKLMNIKTHDFLDFTETYSVYKGNPRIADFEAFLSYHGCDLTSDDDIIGITADVEVVNEYIGGYIHPIISYRQYGVDRTL